MVIQSTPVISRLLGAKIRERELSGSPVIWRRRAKITTRELRITDTPKFSPKLDELLGDKFANCISNN